MLPHSLVHVHFLCGGASLGYLYEHGFIGRAHLRSVLLLLPGIGSTAILGFITSWNEYLFSGILSFKNATTATVGTSFFITSYAVEWGNMAAAITLSTIPTALFIFIAQKGLVKGMTAGSVKG